MTPRTPTPDNLGSRLKIAAVLIGWLLSIVGAVWAAAGDRAQVKAELAAAHAAVVDHETRLRAIEGAITSTAADVKWIRQAMEKHIDQRQP